MRTRSSTACTPGWSRNTLRMFFSAAAREKLLQAQRESTPGSAMKMTRFAAPTPRRRMLAGDAQLAADGRLPVAKKVRRRGSTTVEAIEPNEVSVINDQHAYLDLDPDATRLSGYRGEFTASDALWQGTADGSAVYVDNLSGLAGFDIDVTHLTGTPDSQLFFINKTNDTLWVYKINE